MLIYITAPPPTKHKKIIPRLHPLASCLLHLWPCRCLTLHLLFLVVHLFICCSFVVRLFVWLVVALSLCPLLSLLIPSHCHATSLRCVASLVVPLVSLLLSCCIVALSHCCVIALSRRRVFVPLRHRVLSCLIVVSRPVAL